MTNTQWLSVSLGVVLAVLHQGTLGLVVSGVLLMLAGGWWRLMVINTPSGPHRNASGALFHLTGGLLLPLGLGISVAGVQFWSTEQATVTQVDTRTLEGCIVSRVTTRYDLSRFIFESAERTPLGRSVRYRLVWRTFKPPLEGSCWRLTTRLKPPRGTRNATGFDYERWLFAQRICGLGSVKGESAQLLPRRSRHAFYIDARRRMFERLAHTAEPYGSRALIVALGVGVRDLFETRDWTVLQRTGTAHLMAISGLHVGLAAMLGFGLGRYAPIYLVPSAHPEARGAISALLMAVFYAALAGFAVSTVRALVMLVLWYAWRAAGLSVSAISTLFMTAALLLLTCPWMAADTSFWLSAVAVGAIALCVFGRSGVRRWRDRVQLACRIQLGVTFLMMPLTLMVAGGVSWVVVPVNLVLIPLFSVLVVPMVLVLLLTLLLAPHLAHWPAIVLGTSLDVIWQGLIWLAAQPWAFTSVHSSSPWVAFPVVLLGVLVLLPRGFPGRHLAPVLALPLFVLRTPAVEEGNFRLDVLDVGQALAVVIQTRSHHTVYDTGNAWPGGDSADQTLVPFLRSRRVSKLHTVVISHADRDHAGGASTLLQQLPGAAVWVGEFVPGVADARSCVTGQAWSVDGVSFEFLHPPSPEAYEGNQQSCVLLIRGKRHTALLTGDLGGALERRLLDRLPAHAVDVVIGAHHGSLSSSDARFVQHLQSRFVVFSNGFANQWGMPRPEIVERWRAAGTEVLTTAESGHLRFAPDRRDVFELEYVARAPALGRWRWTPSAP